MSNCGHKEFEKKVSRYDGFGCYRHDISVSTICCISMDRLNRNTTMANWVLVDIFRAILVSQIVIGVLIFKWNEDQIKLSEVLKAIDHKPLFGNRRSKTHWLVFMKD